jgi:hypothetical protein
MSGVHYFFRPRAPTSAKKCEPIKAQEESGQALPASSPTADRVDPDVISTKFGFDVGSKFLAECGALVPNRSPGSPPDFFGVQAGCSPFWVWQSAPGLPVAPPNRALSAMDFSASPDGIWSRLRSFRVAC